MRLNAPCRTSWPSGRIPLPRTALRVSIFQTAVQKPPSCEWSFGQNEPNSPRSPRKPQLANGRYLQKPKKGLTPRPLLHSQIENAHTKPTSAQRGMKKAPRPCGRDALSLALKRVALRERPSSRRTHIHISCSPHRPPTCAFRFQ